MKSCAYLRILSPEPMPRQIKGIAPRLGPPIEDLALPLNAPEGAQVAVRTRDQVVVENRVELTHRPPVRMMLRRNPQSCPIVIPDPFSQLGRQPAKDGVRLSVRVGHPLTIGRGIRGAADPQHLLAPWAEVRRHLSPCLGRLQKVDVQTLLAPIVMAESIPLAACLGLGTVPLQGDQFRYEIMI